MNICPTKYLTPVKSILVASLLSLSELSFGEGLTPLIDDFNDISNDSLGLPRQFLNDSIAGGGTTTAQEVNQGIFLAKGEIVPPRGQPGWAGMVLPLNSQNQPQDASAYKGVRLLIKVNAGNMSISANSTEVSNFDYHAAPIMVAADGKFHEVKIPFDTMKRAWSEQTPLNTKTIASLSIVAFGLQKGAFDFALDEVGFYQ